MRLLSVAGTALIAAVTVAGVLTAPAQAAAPDRAAFHRWTSTSDLNQGTTSRAKVANGSVVMTSGTSSTWTSPWQPTSFSMRSLIPSWSISTPTRTSAVIEARVRSGRSTGSWDTVATWAMSTDMTKRASGSAQSDDLARLATDTVVAKSGHTFDGYQIRVTLRRKSSGAAGPTLRAVNAVSATYLSRSISTSGTTMTRTVDLAVPRSSQMTHRGHFPQWGGGGEAWCSPTSTSMVMQYFRSGPPASTYAWSKDSRGYVDHAARYTYDYRYGGTGNWAFNTAYTTKYGLDSFVTRLYNLRDAEAFIRAGIPLVVGVAFGKGQLKGAPISSTPGHLLVIRGFTASGSVITNDPAGSSSSNLKRTYSRSQFEKAWLKGSGGVAYVIRPASRALPADTARW